MKNIICLFILLCAVCANGFAQAAKPADMPQGVYKRQIGKFPNSTDLQGTLLADGSYGLSFKTKGLPGYVRYDKDGHTLESQVGIMPAALPAAVTQAINAQYAGHRIISAKHCNTRTPEQYKEVFLKSSPEHYEIQLNKGQHSFPVYFSPDGKQLNTPAGAPVR